MTKHMSNILPRMVSKSAYARLARRATAKPRIALMGEFSAGKSTLLNLLLGEDFAPTRVTATQVPPIWLSHGSEQGATVFRHDGGIEWHERLDGSDTVFDDCALLHLRIRRPGLEKIDLIDTPGISDPELAHDPLAMASSVAHGVIWCTPATQAWRQSEKAVWSALPRRLRNRSILVVTAADRLTAEDARKVRARLFRETDSLFRHVILMSARDAAAARRNGTDVEGNKAWEATGAPALQAALSAMTGEVREMLEVQLARYQPDPKSPDVQKPAATTFRAAPRPAKDRPEATGPAAAPATAAAPASTPAAAAPAQGPAATGPVPNRAALEARIVAIKSLIDPTKDDGIGPLVRPDLQTLEAGTCEEANAVCGQIEGEIADLATSLWCDLAPDRGGISDRGDAKRGLPSTQTTP